MAVLDFEAGIITFYNFLGGYFRDFVRVEIKDEFVRKGFLPFNANDRKIEFPVIEQQVIEGQVNT